MKYTKMDILGVDDDRSGGIWKHMAKKLKVLYSNTYVTGKSTDIDFREPNANETI